MTTKYAKLDGLIIDRLKLLHRATAYLFMAGLPGGEARKIAEDEGFVEPFRVLDRRLQALRKKELITFNAATGWTLTEKGKLWQG